MKPTLKAGIALGLGVMVWTYLGGFAGWYKDPALANLFYVVILIQAGAIAWGLTMTRSAGKGYGGRLGAGILVSLYGAIIGIFTSLLYSLVLFPNALQEAKEMQLDQLATQGQTAEQIEMARKMMDVMFTPVANTAMGFVMTLLTGFVLSLILAAVIRKKA